MAMVEITWSGAKFRCEKVFRKVSPSVSKAQNTRCGRQPYLEIIVLAPAKWHIISIVIALISVRLLLKTS